MTLAALADCAEIIVCDGGSTDGTVEVARAAGARVLMQDTRFKRPDNKIADFGGVRNQMLDAATYEWFMYVDSDELITPELLAEIRGVVAAGVPAAFWMPRKYVISGMIIECATTYPNRQMRLFHRSRVNRFIKTIHERIEVHGDAEIRELRNAMLVPLSADPNEMRRKWAYYLDLECERRKNITFVGWVSVVLENAKVSVLYLFRLIRNMLLCRGTKMPLSLELQRHWYHLSMDIRLFRTFLARK